jgi:hypothetical protein
VRAPGQPGGFRGGGETGYNGVMLRRFKLLFLVCLAGLGLAAFALCSNAQNDAPKRGRKYKAPPPTARIEVTVLRDSNGKPIENAAIIFHPMVGEKDDGNMELKSNEDGKTVIDVLPIGDTVRLQVIAHGFQTYGEDYKVDQPEMAIDIRMKRPGEQYSIYKSHPLGTQGGKDAPAEPAKDAPKDAPVKTADPTAPTAQPAPPQNP